MMFARAVPNKQPRYNKNHISRGVIMEINRTALPKVELNDLLGSPGSLSDTRRATEAAIRMQVADLMTAEHVVHDEAVLSALIEAKFEHIQDEVIHYLEQLQDAKEKGISGVTVPSLIVDDRFVNTLIDVAREDPLTTEKYRTQLELLALNVSDYAPIEAFDFVDAIDKKDDMIGHETFHTAKQTLASVGKTALHHLVLPTHSK